MLAWKGKEDDLEPDTTTLLASQAYFHINDPSEPSK